MRKGGSTSRFPRRRAGRWYGSRRSGSGFWHPSAYNGEETRRLPLCLEPREEACAELAALEKAVASQLSERSLDEPKLFGRRQTTSDVQERFVSCLKTSTRGNPFKVKVLLDRVCLWDAEQRPSG